MAKGGKEEYTFCFHIWRGAQGLKNMMASDQKNNPHRWGISVVSDWDRMRELLVYLIHAQEQEEAEIANNRRSGIETQRKRDEHMRQHKEKRKKEERTKKRKRRI